MENYENIIHKLPKENEPIIIINPSGVSFPEFTEGRFDRIATYRDPEIKEYYSENSFFFLKKNSVTRTWCPVQKPLTKISGHENRFHLLAKKFYIGYEEIMKAYEQDPIVRKLREIEDTHDMRSYYSYHSYHSDHSDCLPEWWPTTHFGKLKGELMK
jgi:hypothetical protein